jgi:hypothetical protein
MKMFLTILALTFAGCATPPPPPSSAAPKTKPAVGDISNPEAENPPFIGMTKAQALARYGEPKRRTLTDEGENWVYILNFGEVMGRALIPFNFKPTAIRTSVLIFGPDGRVKRFHWDVPTEN